MLLKMSPEWIFRSRKVNKKGNRDFPGGPVVKTLHSQGRGLRFNP